jgi:threonine dehydratase
MNPLFMELFTFSDLQHVQRSIASTIKRTPVLSNREFDEQTGGQVVFKCENFQRTGSFKLRGSCNTVFNLSDEDLTHGVATHSSGNHGQALAFAAKIKGIPAYIVMPRNAPQVKKGAVKDYGAQVTFCEPTQEARESTLTKVVSETNAAVIHPYDNTDIIAGQGTAVMELLEDHPDLDLILAPVGGGGLLSGTAIGAKNISPNIKVIGCEPKMADDAFRSFRSGTLQPASDTTTIADGLRTTLSGLTFEYIQKYVHDIVTLSEQQIIDAMRFVWEQLKIVTEPSAAVPVAAILHNKIDVKNKKTGVILSGGNVDLERLPWQ